MSMTMMMRRKTLGLLGLFLLCAIPSGAEDAFERATDYTRIARQGEWQNSDAKNNRNQRIILKRDTDWSGDEIFANGSGCWRYCVKKKVHTNTERKDLIKRVNIVWNVMDKAGMNVTEKTSNRSDFFTGQNQNVRWESSTISSENSKVFYDDDSKCELYIELGCESSDLSSKSNSTTDDEHSKFDEEELTAKNHTIGSSSDLFFVDERTEKLRILAFGKLARIVLEIPMARRGNNSTDENRTKPTFLLSRTSDAEGLLIDARNPPPGEWRLNFLGIRNFNYSFSVTAIKSLRKERNSNVESWSIARRLPTNESTRKNEYELDEEVDEVSSRPRQTAYPRIVRDNDSKRVIESNDEQDNSPDSSLNLGQPLVLPAPSAKALIAETSETRISEEVNFEAELMDLDIEEKLDEKKVEKNGKIVGVSELDKLSMIIEETERKSRTIVDLYPNAELFATPGTFHDVIFTVTNNQALGIRHTFQGSSKPFRYVGVIPNESWIRPGQTIAVAVRIQVPNVDQPEPNTVTLRVHGNDNFEAVEKSTYVYVRNPDGRTTADSDKPSIDWSFNDNCAGKLHHDRCSLSRWSVEINVSDPDSGLKRVTSVPSGITPRSEFVSGAKNKVTFYYSATCCYTTVDITAIDLSGNSNARTIDVTAWDNLNRGELAAVIVGALLIVLLLVFLILMIIYCVRKRKSHDLSYSQRYGSRSPASAERTNY